MDKEQLQILSKTLKGQLEQSEKLWEEREPGSTDKLAFIVGYLQGSIKEIISRLDNEISLK
jgi:hypothetical protein